MKRLFTLACLALPACSTPGSLRENRPIIAASSAKSVQDISSCIVENWQKRSSQVSSLPRAKGVTLTLNGQFFSNTYAAVIVDIDDDGEQRSVAAYIKGASPDAPQNDDPGNREITSCL